MPAYKETIMSDSLHVVCPHCSTVNRIPRTKLGSKPVCGNCKNDIFSAQPLESSGEQFVNHITRNDIPVLVDFWAPWCGPCKMMAPSFAQAAQRLEPGIRLIKVNTENEQHIAGQYAIRSIPTMVLFKNGKEVARQSGAMNAEGIVAWADSKSA
jgi:thioredoxin 2